MRTFGYDAEIVDRFPSIVGGVIFADGLVNGPTPPQLQEAYQAEQASVGERLAVTPIAELPSIAAWRRTFTACGVKPTQHRVAAEALLRRLHKHGNIPTISLLVDLGNLVSIRYGLPVAVLDQATVSGGTTVRFADGTERFTDLGSDVAVAPAPDEVIFVDDDGLVSARRWCWRQSGQSATSTTTTTALFTVEAMHVEGSGDVAAALHDLSDLLQRFQPAVDLQQQTLTAAEPATSF